MDKDVLIWLTDIKAAITEIKQFLPVKKTFSEFQKSLKTKRAIERNIEIIGEAVSRILKVQSDIKISNARKIIDTRNRIIHGYDFCFCRYYLGYSCKIYSGTGERD